MLFFVGSKLTVVATDPHAATAAAVGIVVFGKFFWDGVIGTTRLAARGASDLSNSRDP
jgi:hypothetical protein